MMDIGTIMPWASFAVAIFALLGHLKTYFGGAKIDALDKAVDDHDRRIQALEGEMKHLPDQQSVVDLKLALSDLRGTVNTLAESVGSVGRTVHRIDDYLRQDGGVGRKDPR